MLGKKFLVKGLIAATMILGVSVSFGVAADAQQSPAQAQKVKPFKAAIVNDNYDIYGGVSGLKQSSTKYFHKTFLINKKFTLNNRQYYWLTTTKKYKTVGYINKNAVATPNQTRLVKVPYVSQYKPVFSPWGCAGAAMTMVLRSQGKKVNLKYVQDHLPMYPTKGGQRGNVYTGVGFGYVIQPGALTKYARKWDKNVINISGKQLTVNAIKQYVQGGKPVLYYGFSSYQKAGDRHRNHCKVIAGYKNHKFLVYDPLYYSKSAKAGSGGKNMKYDHGAIAWVSESAVRAEFNHQAITVK